MRAMMRIFRTFLPPQGEGQEGGINTFKYFFNLLFKLSFFSIFLALCGCNEHLVGMFDPKGIIAYQEHKLFYDTLALMLIVVLPVIIMSITFVYHYQVSHHIRDYKPNWSHSYFLESLWWGIPCVIIVILATITWKKSHELDPYNKIPGVTGTPLLIQVIALPWKWLFIYPQQGIATVNYLEIPVGQQVEYWITTDNVPMSAFFVPQLGSQIYTMAGMRTRLHLVADKIGVYDGMNTQFNGDGFSDMHFETHVVELAEMTRWVDNIKKSPTQLTDAAYKELLVPADAQPPKFYSHPVPDLFDSVLMTYMNSSGPLHPRSHTREFVNFQKEQ